MRRLGGRIATALLGVLLAGAGTAAAVQAPAADAAQRELQGVQELLARAVAEFDGAQQSRSIVLFDEIISRLDLLRVQGALPASGRDVLAQAYELRARAYFNIGLQDKAAESFRSLVQFQPQHTLSPERGLLGWLLCRRRAGPGQQRGEAERCGNGLLWARLRHGNSPTDSAARARRGRRRRARRPWRRA